MRIKNVLYPTVLAILTIVFMLYGSKSTAIADCKKLFEGNQISSNNLISNNTVVSNINASDYLDDENTNLLMKVNRSNNIVKLTEKHFMRNTVSQNVMTLVKTSKETATIVAVGDCLVHSQVYKDAYNSTNGEYDFSSIFKDISPYMQDADVTIANLESPLAGAEKGYSSYPCFNCPEHLAIDLKELGVDVVSTANNHCLDKGYSGLSNSLNVLDNADILHVGTSRSSEEQSKILFKDLNGIKTAFLSYTYGTNGISIPQEKSYCVNLIDKDLIKRQLDDAKAQGAELIIVSMHWGIEYQTDENKEQDELADFLIENGANIILGSHPHVLQPIKNVTVSSNNGDIHTGLVLFSMGNFFSGQTKENTRDTAIFKIKVSKENDTVSVNDVSFKELYDYDNGKQADDRYELLDLSNIIDEYNSVSSSQISENSTSLQGTSSDSSISANSIDYKKYELAVEEKQKIDSILLKNSK